MHFKLIIIMTEDARTQQILDAAREAGATGCTVLNQARGEGINPTKTFLGLSIDSQVDVIMMLAQQPAPFKQGNNGAGCCRRGV